MAKTTLADVIVPDVFNPYVRERSIHLNKLIQSGALGLDPEFNRLASGPGIIIDIPFFKDLTGSSSVLSDSASLTPDKINTGQDSAAKNVRGKAWAANLLTKWLTGEDPVAAIGDAVAHWWNRDHQTTTLAQL